LILVLVGALFTLARSEVPTNIDTETYFGTSEFMLNTDSEDQLYTFIEYSVLSQIKKAFDDDVLIELRIEGHTDKRMPEPIGDKKWYQFSKERRWKDNMELSFFRAEGVAATLDKIIKKSFSEPEQIKLNKMISIAGFGSNKPQYIHSRVEGMYYALNVDSIKTDSLKYYNRIKMYPNKKISGPFEKPAEARDLAYKMNRRVVINIIKRGI